MQLPVQITFRNMEPSEAVEARIREEVAKLERFHDRIMGCRVIVEMPRKHPHHGKVYEVRVDLTLPGGELVVRPTPSVHGTARQLDVERETKSLEVEGAYKDVYVAIRDAFKATRRRLQDHVRRHRGDVKTHEATPHARVSRLFPGEDYGFLETPDGLDVYFHRNSVLGGGFDRLQVGTEVTFVEEEGERGPQASTVRLAGRQRVH
jgi:cold shock CspA family protein/ribosome-associated translation inhibitor RaiA